MLNDLYFGDNLDILKRYIPDESVDLVYLDPPFNSNQNYNVLFKEQNGNQSASQILAFEDTWTWGQDDVAVYEELITQPGKVSGLMQGFYSFLGPCNMMSYLVMMAPRLMELKRVMKPTASIYLHCDPTASHYLKLLMDAVFGAENFRNEIVWKRTSARSDSHKWNHIHDNIFYYTKTGNYIWNTQYIPYNDEYVKKFYRFVEPETGRRYTSSDLMASGLRNGSSGKVWRGIDPAARGNHWKYTIETLDELDERNRILWPTKKEGGVPRYKRYLDEMPGVAIQSIIIDIPPLSAQAIEKLGYPTQKPLALLERIIAASSNPEEVVLDPFCGCGTAIHAAHKLGRRWIGIDITHIAVTLMKNRLKDMFGLEPASKKNPDGYRVIGEPVTLTDAEALAAADKYQFQYWALGLVGARPEKKDEKKGADKGIDGKILFIEEATGKLNTVVLSVKGGAIPASHVRELLGVVDREKAAMGVLICLHQPTRNMIEDAANAGFYESVTWGRKYPKIQILTISDLLDPNNPKAIQMPPVKATFKKAAKVPLDVHGQLKLDET